MRLLSFEAALSISTTYASDKNVLVAKYEAKYWEFGIYSQVSS